MLARFFDLAPKSRLGVGPVSSKREVTAGAKEAKTNNLTFHPLKSNPTRSLWKIATDGHGIFPGSDNFPQSPSNLAGTIQLERVSTVWRA
jgi:hypothetical protein